MTSGRRCVFYRTLAIVDNATSGSALRPSKLLQAFRQLGYEVDVVAGRAGVRKPAIQRVRQNILQGVRYDFLYAEPPTTPVLLNESHHLPTHPFMDHAFLAFCHSRGIPIVLFYSDVQWRLPDYPKRLGWPKYLAALPFFHLDLFMYRRIVDALLVPDRAMLPRVARWASTKPSWASIPGFDPSETATREPLAADTPLRLFYVGGVTPPVYDLTPLLRGSALALSHGVRHELTICCREPEWAKRPAAYEAYLDAHVDVVHNKTRQELLELYSRHDIAVMPYGTLNADWAMPIKFPEAIGMELPVIAGAGTPVARMVAEQGIGWSVGDRPEDLYNVLKEVTRAELERVRANVVRVKPQYSWMERAREVASIADEVRAERRPGRLAASPAEDGGERAREDL